MKGPCLACPVYWEEDSMALIRRRVTSRMLEANRRNAARSTGPRSSQAKAHVRVNTIRHGRRSIKGS